jgi:mRNA-degrading endonuclease toxin of MazEF toxin-antitoxin module
MNRGDVWLIDLGGRIGRRPVVILTRQKVLHLVNKVTVVEITTRGKGYPTEIDIDQKANLPKSSFVHADGLHTVPKQRLEKYVGTVDSELMREVSRKVVLALELETVIDEA